MYYLFSTSQQQLAIRFQQFIRQQYQQQIEIKQEKGVFHLFISEQSEQMVEIKQAAEQFLANPEAEQFYRADWQQESRISWRELWKPLLVTGSRFRWQRLWQNKFCALVTLICILVFALTYTDWQQQIFFYFHFPVFPEQQFELWRYFSHSLVHLSPAHILFNLMWWWIFAGLIERYQGTFKLCSLYAISAVTSGIAQDLSSGADFFGLSGVVYAVLGYVFVENYLDPNKRFAIPSGFGLFLVIGIVSGFFAPLIGVAIGNSAHIAGLITGSILAGIDVWRQKSVK